MDLTPFMALVILFVALPWIVLHHITKWKTAATLTQGDERLLDELYQLARRLEDRMTTVERLVAHDHPDFTPPAPNARASDDLENEALDALARNRAARPHAERNRT